MKWVKKNKTIIFCVPEMNKNIILGRDRLKQFSVQMFYDLDCIWVGTFYVKMEEDIHISALVRLGSKTIIKPQTGMLCWNKVQGSCQLSKTNYTR